MAVTGIYDKYFLVNKRLCYRAERDESCRWWFVFRWACLNTTRSGLTWTIKKTWPECKRVWTYWTPQQQTYGGQESSWWCRTNLKSTLVCECGGSVLCRIPPLVSRKEGEKDFSSFHPAMRVVIDRKEWENKDHRETAKGWPRSASERALGRRQYAEKHGCMVSQKGGADQGAISITPISSALEYRSLTAPWSFPWGGHWTEAGGERWWWLHQLRLGESQATKEPSEWTFQNHLQIEEGTSGLSDRWRIISGWASLIASYARDLLRRDVNSVFSFFFRCLLFIYKPAHVKALFKIPSMADLTSWYTSLVSLSISSPFGDFSKTRVHDVGRFVPPECPNSCSVMYKRII